MEKNSLWEWSARLARVTPGTHQRERAHTEFLSRFINTLSLSLVSPRVILRLLLTIASPAPATPSTTTSCLLQMGQQVLVPLPAEVQSCIE
jgi:hypothetical protein